MKDWCQGQWRKSSTASWTTGTRGLSIAQFCAAACAVTGLTDSSPGGTPAWLELPGSPMNTADTDKPRSNSGGDGGHGGESDQGRKQVE
jgi:hypothetical protein